MRYADYLDDVLCDVKNYIDENKDYLRGCDIDNVMDDMELSVTGNDNGSYYCSSAKARAAVEGVVFDNDFHNAANHYGFCLSDYLDSPETFDVVVRIVAFHQLYDEIYTMVENAIEEVEYDD